MGLRVNTNVDALNIHRNLNLVNDKVSQSLKRLSSGRRIESAKDDAAGLAIANTFRAKVSSMRVAYQNASESNAMLQIADGAYSKISDILVRMKDLATQAAGGQVENTNRAQMNTEFLALQSELDRISQSSTYGGQTLVYSTGAPGATSATLTFQIGSTNNATDRIVVDLNSVSTASLAISSNVGIGSQASAQSTMTALDTALTSVNDYMANLGAYQNRLQHTMENISIQIENFSASESTIRDVDMANEVMNFTKNQILQQSGMAMLAQSNQAPQQILQLLGG